eukprot:UN09604
MDVTIVTAVRTSSRILKSHFCFFFLFGGLLVGSSLICLVGSPLICPVGSSLILCPLGSSLTFTSSVLVFFLVVFYFVVVVNWFTLDLYTIAII